MSDEDKTRLEEYGLTVFDITTSGIYYSAKNVILWNDNFTFEPLAFYSDVDGTQQTQMDMTKISCVGNSRGGQAVLQVHYDGTDSTPNKTWKCRITKK